MATPIYRFLKGSKNDPNKTTSGFTTYTLPGYGEDASQQYQNPNYKVNFSKFILLNLDLSKMDFDNQSEFNTESTQVITEKGENLVTHLRNYVANHETVIRNSKINNNNSFYDPNELQTTSEKIFWKWLRKTGSLEFEPAIPNDEYIDSSIFAVDDTSDDDYFKEFLWKERSVIPYTITGIIDTGLESYDPKDNVLKKIYRIDTSSSTNIKSSDLNKDHIETIKISSEGNINIGFVGDREFSVERVETDTTPENESRNNWIYIYSDITLIFNNFATASLELVYEKVVQYIGEISSINNVQNEDRSYTEVLAYIPDQNGQTPDILFRTGSDKNYSPGLQYPILPSQDQPEIIGGEQFDSPIVTNPELFPGDQYGLFDIDQKYQNSSGLQDRKRGDYYGVLESNRKQERVASAPYVYPEFDGSNIDGLTVDFDALHYVKMNLAGRKTENFDEFNALSINNTPPKDFKFNAVVWFYETEDQTLSPTETTTTSDSETSETDTETIITTTITRQEIVPNEADHKAMNMYGITFLQSVVDDEMGSFSKLVANGDQDGLSYQFNLNLNFNISEEVITESYDENKVYSLFGFDLFNEVMVRLSNTNDIFLKLVNNLERFQTDLNTIKSLLYTQTSINDINARIDTLNKLLDLYKRNQIVNSDTISVEIDDSTNPPSIKLNSIDARYGNSIQLPVSVLYNSQNNTVIDYKAIVPPGKDFMINIINDDNSDVLLDRNLNVVLEKDLDYKQTCDINIYPSSASYNKKINISMVTGLIDNVDTISGHNLFGKSLDLPIDNNLNPSLELDGISKRWSSIPDNLYPNKYSIKKISDNYYLVVEFNSLITSSFKTGDVLQLDNMSLVYTNTNGDYFSDISGQYEIIGDIENNEINFLIPLQSFKVLFDEIDIDNGGSNQYEIIGSNFIQPASIRYNPGYTISITAIDRDSTTLNERYLVNIKPLNKVFIDRGGE